MEGFKFIYMKFIGYYNYTVILTYIGLISSTLGIYSSFCGNNKIAVICLMISGLVDMFDGKVARTRKATDDEKLFGIQIDSLCDLISFGVLPATIVLSITGSNLFTVIVSVLYVLCALIRLSYFNVDETRRQAQTTSVREEYFGLPVTSISLSLPIFYVLRNTFSQYFSIALTVMLAVWAFLFILKFKMKKPKWTEMIIFIILGLVEFILLIIF